MYQAEIDFFKIRIDCLMEKYNFTETDKKQMKNYLKSIIYFTKGAKK